MMADETNIRELNMVGETNVTDEMKDCKVSLKSSEKTISTLVCVLSVPNFFVLPQYDSTEYEVKSPSFEYCNATWQFKFQSDLDYSIEDHTFDIYLLRLNYRNPKQMISCTIYLLDVDGEKYDIGCRTYIMDDDNSDNEEKYICSFNSDKPLYDRRETLTLIIYLISDESFEEHADQVIKGDIEALSQDYKKLFLNGKKRDLTLKVSDKEFRVHQDILMARCQVFEAMLTHDMKEKEKGAIDVSDCNPESMEQFLFYVYCGRVETLNQENVLGLYYTADKYQMTPLKEQCSNFIKQSFSPSMICDVVQLALNHSDADLLKCATQYFVDHISQIVLTVGWMSLLKSNMVAANELLIKATNKTTDETRNCKVSLTMSKEKISSLVCTLSVPNFFILPECNTNFKVKSPSFVHANATWQFKFKADMDDKENHSFGIYLLRLNYTNPKQMIICAIELLNADGEKYDIGCRECDMDGDDDDDDGWWYICDFNNVKPSYDRRDTLTLTIHLVSDESFEVHTDQVPLLIKGDVETLSQDYKKLFLNGKNQDLTLKVADKEFRVHQDILMARCQLFEDMLTDNRKENEESVIDMSDCDPQAMEQFLFYVYSGKVETSNQENALGLYHIVDKFLMVSLKEDCSKFIKQSLSPSMVCDVVLLALNHSDADLLECSTQYFVNHISQILRTVGWMSFLKSNMVAANELLIKATNKWDCSKS